MYFKNENWRYLRKDLIGQELTKQYLKHMETIQTTIRLLPDRTVSSLYISSSFYQKPTENLLQCIEVWLPKRSIMILETRIMKTFLIELGLGSLGSSVNYLSSKVVVRFRIFSSTNVII